jgi:hypothetical protein
MAERSHNIDGFAPQSFSPKIIVRLAVVIIVVLLLVWLSPFGTIAAGERGVHLRFTAVQSVKEEGLYLDLRALEKWNGVLPQVTGNGGIPFINLPK